MKRIAIIGGGPAGAMAAERLARDGAAAWGKVSVTVFEEKLAWEKPCGGALTWKALRHYPFLKESCHAHRRVDEAELIAPNGKSVRFSLRLPLDIYSRSTLDNLLLDRARQAGAEIVPDRIQDRKSVV